MTIKPAPTINFAEETNVAKAICAARDKDVRIRELLDANSILVLQRRHLRRMLTGHQIAAMVIGLACGCLLTVIVFAMGITVAGVLK